MKIFIRFSIVVTFLLLGGCVTQRHPVVQLCSTVSLHDVIDAIPKTVQELQQQTQATLDFLQKELAHIVYIPAQKRTYYNTIQALDSLCMKVQITAQKADLLNKLHPDKAMRAAAYESSLQLQEQLENALSSTQVQKALQAYQSEASDTFKKQDFVKKWLYIMQRKGAKKQQKVVHDTMSLMDIQKRISLLTGQLLGTMNMHISSVNFLPEQLAGIAPYIRNQWPVDKHHTYAVPLQADAYDAIMEQAYDPEVRKEFFQAYFNQGYPFVVQLLKRLLQAQNVEAQLLGYPTIAHWQLQDTYLKHPRAVEKFLTQAGKPVRSWSKDLYKKLKTVMPHYFVDHGKIDAWNDAFIKSQFQKYMYQIDSNTIAQYFEFKHVFDVMLALCGQWSGVTFERVECDEDQALWSDDVFVYRVKDQYTKQIRGFIFFDLFERDGKVQSEELLTIMPTVADDCTIPCTGALALITQLAKPKNNKPLFLSLDQVATLFHEMGHAMHALLHVQRLSQISGLAVEADTVEIPAYVFEMLLYTPEVLQQVAQHYETKQPLSESMLDTILQAENFGRMCRLKKQLFLSDFALQMTQQTQEYNFEKIAQKLYKKHFPEINWSSDYHFYAQWPHLASQAALYYRYVFAEVAAMTIIKKFSKNNKVSTSFSRWLQQYILSPYAYSVSGVWLNKALPSGLQYTALL